MERKVVKLDYPLNYHGETINEIVIKKKRLKAKDLRRIPSSFFEKEGENLSYEETLPIVGVMTDLPDEVIDEIDLDDLPKIVEAVSFFFTESQGTGNKSSG